MKKARDKSKATYPFLMDLGAEHTSAYSAKGFATYIIAKDGTLVADLAGTKMRRPSVETVLEKLDAAIESANN